MSPEIEIGSSSDSSLDMRFHLTSMFPRSATLRRGLGGCFLAGGLRTSLKVERISLWSVQHSAPLIAIVM